MMDIDFSELSAYTILALEARKKLIELLLKQEKEIRNIQVESVDNVAKQLKTAEVYQVLEKLDVLLLNEADNLKNRLQTKILGGITISVEAGMYQSKQATLSLLNKSKIDWKPIERVFFRTHDEAVRHMLYRTIKGLNLSQRIWEKSRKTNDALGSIIQEAIREGIHPTKIAELLERYVREGAKTIAVEYPNMFERLSVPMDLNYESLRLARTETAAAFGHATVESAKINPANRGIKWSISNAGVTCDVCKEIANHDSGLGKGIYEPDDLPEYPAHPNCLCNLSEVTEDIDNLIDRLIEWQKNPLSQPDIEKWYQTVYKQGMVE